MLIELEHLLYLLDTSCHEQTLLMLLCSIEEVQVPSMVNALPEGILSAHEVVHVTLARIVMPAIAL